jgi:membrane protein
MPALLGLMAMAASEFVPADAIRDVASRQVRAVVGVESASQIVDVVEGAVELELAGPAAVIGILALVFGATGAFNELQSALNLAWEVQRDPRRGDVALFLFKRGVSLIMIAALGVLLVLSILTSTAISIVRSYFLDDLPASLQGLDVPLADLGVSLVVVSVVVTLILQLVPDAVVRWRDAAVGGLFTGVLFTLGKLLIGYYLVRSDPGNVFGAAGSLAVALLWIYYSAIILLLGAEFTEAWACRNGAPVVPSRGAVSIRKQLVYADSGEDTGKVAPA